MKKSLIALSALVFLSTQAFSIDLTLSSNQMLWSDQGFIQASISNLIPGARVQLCILQDRNQNGVLDSRDLAITVFDLQDGVTNEFGATTILDDDDALTNGIIQTAVSMYGDTVLHTIGDYFWQAIELDPVGFPISTNAVSFSVLQLPSPIEITGEILDYSTSNAVPGAIAYLIYPEVLGNSPSIWADTNGEFSIYLPSGIASNEIFGVYALASGYLSVESDPETGEFISEYLLQQQLLPGSNSLPNPLFVVPEIPSKDLYTISGRILWTDGNTTNPLEGVLVSVEDDDESLELDTYDISASDGSYYLVYPRETDDWGEIRVAANDPLLALRGLFADQLFIHLVASTNGVDIYCHPANTFSYGRVEDQDTNDPLEGVKVNLLFGGDLVASTYTISNGLYELAFLENTYNLACDELSLQTLRYKPSEGSTSQHYLSHSAGDRREYNFSYKFSYLISGYVYDASTLQPIPYGAVQLTDLQEDSGPAENHAGALPLREEIKEDVDVALDGHYYLLAAPGTWWVRTENEGAFFLDCYYTNSPLWDLSAAIPIPVTSNHVSGIDFYLDSGARLSGSVFEPDMRPAGDVEVKIYQVDAQGNPTFLGSNFTDWDTGGYSVLIPAGSNLCILADGGEWGQYPKTWYGGVGTMALATPTNILPQQEINSLDIIFLEGFTVSGSIFEQETGSDILGATITLLDQNHFEYAMATAGDWGYSINVPTDQPYTFRVEADGYAGEYFLDTYDFSSAVYTQALAWDTVGIDFTIYSTNLDSDADGLPDYKEDSVPDGIFGPDDFSDPTNPDTDADGASDESEYEAGTDAQDPNSIFKITGTQPVGSSLELRWNSVPGRDYTIQIRSSLTGGSWSNLTVVTALAPETIYPLPITSEKSYYRVLVPATP